MPQFTQCAAEHTDALDRAIAFVFKAANDVELILGVAHHLSDIDIPRFAHQTDAAIATAHCIEITLLTEIVDDLHQVWSCLIDGEAIVCDENGLAVFELIRGHGSKTSAVLCAFDLLELDGRDLRRRPIEERKGLLAKLLHDSDSDLSIVLNKHFEEDGAVVFREACRLGCVGIVSKKLGSIYRRGRSPLWLKVKNPNAPAVKREAEEDWGR